MLKALAGGLAGAAALTLIHETARKTVPHAPRVDVIGERAIAGPIRAAGYLPPPRRRLYWWTLAGEVVSNSLYYSLVGVGRDRHAFQRGAVLWLLAGLGAVFLPPVMGLGRQPGRKSPWTEVMTVAWYLAGGLAAAAAVRMPDKWSGRD